MNALNIFNGAGADTGFKWGQDFLGTGRGNFFLPEILKKSQN